jgi:hypothetical protein
MSSCSPVISVLKLRYLAVQIKGVISLPRTAIFPVEKRKNRLCIAKSDLSGV